MLTFAVIYAFIIGLVLGSFYNVVGLRWVAGESVVSPRSHCPNCKRTLQAIDLIPLLSYLVLKGRCRGCQTKISLLYPTMELMTGSLFATMVYIFGFSTETIVALLFVSLLHIIVVTDLTAMLILNRVLLLFFIPIALLRFSIAPLEPWWDAPLAGAVGFLVLLAIAYVSKGGMGGGDIKLFFVLGFVLGTVQTLLTLFFASVIGAVVGLSFRAFGWIKRRQHIPFAPFIAMAALIAYIIGENIWAWYVQWL
ncbi:prepilin peptidase [Texcoconibacillus texcoconensis]|uniref:Leader peptidase (Prepilin peptidase)/N-methyltransferase n=1 Tax=Texcoconibacillus texcoconensis TaxID=1095777 RepID=A0A840QSP9_9BACI|nr:A24 family peptidase [Texcoconibacillus texcoconensis]MBB5174395.1 leader peptidase (prepilin peptidase)/N-methyltransferase [Texcoconibacillus texcoconensis]